MQTIHNKAYIAVIAAPYEGEPYIIATFCEPADADDYVQGYERNDDESYAYTIKTIMLTGPARILTPVEEQRRKEDAERHAYNKAVDKIIEDQLGDDARVTRALPQHITNRLTKLPLIPTKKGRKKLEKKGYSFPVPGAWACPPGPITLMLDEYKRAVPEIALKLNDLFGAPGIGKSAIMGAPGIGKAKGLKKIIKRMKKERKEEKRALKKAKKRNR